MKIGMSNALTGHRSLAFSPSRLFVGGEAGDWFDPADLSRMWQDTAGTVAVTADGQPVQRIDGQRGILSLVEATNPPTYKTSGGLHWLQFDGTGDTLASSATFDMTGTDAVTVTAAISKTTDASIRSVVELSASVATNNGAFNLSAPANTGVANYGGVIKGTGTAAPAATTYTAPNTSVVTVRGDISADSAILRVNGADVASTATDLGTGNFGNYTLYVGSRAGTSRFHSGNIYFLLIRGALTSGAQLSSLEQFAARKSGITL